MEEDQAVSSSKGETSTAPVAGSEGAGSTSTSGAAAEGVKGGDGEKEEAGEKKEGGAEGEEDSETPQYLARLLSELITGMVAPGMEAAPNDGT